MPSQSALFTVMERAARKSAVRLRRDFNEVEHLQVSVKGPSDFVSAADHRSEETLRYELERARPGWGFLMEESGVHDGEHGQPRWIVDPLDGTTNFLHGVPHFAISIAVEQDEEIIAGLVHNPLTDESFFAEKGGGAWLHHSRLRVSARSNIHESLLGTGIPFRGCGDPQTFGEILQRVMPKVAGVRRFGAAALDLAWVAAGRFDGFWEQGLKAWDTAAGIILVREAGGLVCDYAGEKATPYSDNFIATNTRLHEDVKALINSSGQL